MRKLVWGIGAVFVCAVLVSAWIGSRHLSRVDAAINGEIVALDARLEMLRALDQARDADAIAAWLQKFLDVEAARDVSLATANLRAAENALAFANDSVEKYESKARGNRRIESELQGDMTSAVQLQNRMAGAPWEAQVAVENEIRLSAFEAGLWRRWARENADKAEKARQEVKDAEREVRIAKEAVQSAVELEKDRRAARSAWYSVSEEVERREQMAARRAESARRKAEEIVRFAETNGKSRAAIKQPNVGVLGSAGLRKRLEEARRDVDQFTMTDPIMDIRSHPHPGAGPDILHGPNGRISWAKYWTTKRLAMLLRPNDSRRVIEAAQEDFSYGAPAEMAEDRADKWESAVKAAEDWRRAEEAAAEIWERTGLVSGSSR